MDFISAEDSDTMEQC